jgi:hypothetical protein
MGEQGEEPNGRQLSEEEIVALEGEHLPDREVMSVLTLNPGPPMIGDWEPPPQMPAGNAIEPPPPTD